MRMTMNRDALLHAAQVASKVASHGMTAAMCSVLVEASDGECSFTATDGDQAVKHADIASVDDHGKCLVSAQALAKVVKAMRDGAVTLESGDGSVTVEGGGSRFTLPSLDCREWMGTPYDGDGPTCKLEAGVLQEMCKRVAPFCDAAKEAREMLRGVHVASDGGNLKMEASDSYRIAICEQPADGAAFDALVPRDFLLQAADAMNGEVSVTSDGNRIRLACGSTEMSARCLSAKFPDVARMLPQSPSYELTVRRYELLGVVNRATQLGNGKFGMSLDCSGGEMELSASVKDVGSFSERMKCDGELSIFLDSQFLKSCVEAMDCDDVTIAGDSEQKPMTFRGGSVVALMLPMRRGD